MKKLSIVLLLAVISVAGYCQTYNNEWIDYSKTYYKFKVGATGLYRISRSALTTIGLGSTPAENFQLWRNGVEVPIYTSSLNGALGVNGFIEFYGLMNDGKADTKLYKYDSLQMSDHWSLYTDTAAYFLTLNTTTENKRLLNIQNNVSGNSLTPEPYCIYKLGKYFKETMNLGFGYDLGAIVHSSSYEAAEGWSSNEFATGAFLTSSNTGLHVYTGGPSATFDAVINGNSLNSREVAVGFNNTNLGPIEIDDFNAYRLHVGNIPTSAFLGDNANVYFQNDAAYDDHLVVANYEITYPRQFDFDGKTQFNFQLPANNNGSYLAINNFNYGATDPILYDLTNGLRLVGVVSSGIVKFMLPPSATARDFVLLSADASSVFTVSNFTQRNFINYSQPANQGDYLIISHSLLFNDGSGNNNVENYRSYRSSVDGGSYNAKIYDIDQLTDQFAFGIKHHPSAVRNFSAYAIAKFSVLPKFLLLIGKGLNYEQFRSRESDPSISKQALVPTFGTPASDNILTATRTGEAPTIATGRISAINGIEIKEYLDKVKEFELVQRTNAPPAEKAWMKNIAQVTGGLSDPSLSTLITSYMKGYQAIAADTLFGAKVYDFNENLNGNVATGTNKTIQDLFSNGISLLTYFGHSSPNSIEFNLDNPENYNNTGKYPVMMINGCEAGDLFLFDTLRALTGGSLSEKYIFADRKGSIAFISSSHFGLPTELNYVNTEFYRNLCNRMYGQPLGSIMKTTMTNVYNIYSADYIAQTHVEEINLHGDPAVRINPFTAPDYTIVDSMISFDPSPASVADGKVTIKIKFLNNGKATRDSLPLLIQHKFPDNTIAVLFNAKVRVLKYEDSLTLTIDINPLKDTGINQLLVTIDPNNIISELSESNNTASNNFTIFTNEVRPVWPYQYSIISDPNIKLYASTADPTAVSRDYVLQIDTTALFNSAFKVTRNVTSTGGVIQFSPGISYTDSTVYYWRVAVGTVTPDTRWLSSSFIYLNGGSEGYSQSHYHQYKANTFQNTNIDSASRRLNFDNKSRNLLIRTGLYPYYGWDQINVNLDNKSIESYGCVYSTLQILVYDPLTLTPWKNYNTNGSGRFGSAPINDPKPDGTRNLFEFPYDNATYRKNAIQFFDSIPNGYYVSITNLGLIYNTVFIDDWKADTATLGSGKSLWHKLHSLGLDHIDSFTTNLPFLFLFKKGDANFPVYQSIGPLPSTHIAPSFDLIGKVVSGTVQSPWFGPAKAWKRFKWNKTKFDSSQTTTKRFDIVGKNINGTEVVLRSVYNANDTDISTISAAQYPNLKLLMYNQDSAHAQPVQLRYWMLTADKAPEGAVSPNILFSTKDSLTIYDTLRVRVAFKNVSNVAFDSLKVRLTVTDVNGVDHIYNNLGSPSKKSKKLPASDTVIVYYDIPLQNYPGLNQWKIDVNPDADQLEQFHFNNTLYRSFYVSYSVCSGGNISFSTGPSISGSTYQWQVDTGTGYIPVVTNAIYSGINSSTLLLTTPPTSMTGYKYRCAITNNSVVNYSKVSTLRFSSLWIGTISDSWENANNWNCGVVPDAYTDVVLQVGVPNYPVIKSNPVCRSITASPGTTITVNAGFSLDIKGKPGQ